MNKNDLIDALVPRLGDRAAAGLAVEALVDVVLRQVAAGGSVGITGFGTFEPVERAARTGRNPHTGEAVPIGATRSPRFRPGSYFKAVVADPARLPGDGLAGARVGSTDERGAGAGSRETRAGSPSSGSTGHGAPVTIRRSADAGDRSGSRVAPEATDVSKPARGSRRTGTPATVRADRPAPSPASATEPARQRGAGGRMSIGGEQITRDMISAKKAQLARVKDDQIAEKAARRGGAKAGKDTRDERDAQPRRTKQEKLSKQDSADKKDKKSAKDKKKTKKARKRS